MQKLIFIWFKFGVWWFFIIGGLMAFLQFINLFLQAGVNESGNDLFNRLIGFILPAIFSFLGYLDTKAKTLWQIHYYLTFHSMQLTIVGFVMKPHNHHIEQTQLTLAAFIGVVPALLM